MKIFPSLSLLTRVVVVVAIMAACSVALILGLSLALGQGLSALRPNTIERTAEACLWTGVVIMGSVCLAFAYMLIRLCFGRAHEKPRR